MGLSRACQRQARSRYVENVTTTAATMKPGRALVMASQMSEKLTLRKNSQSKPAVRATTSSVCHRRRMGAVVRGIGQANRARQFDGARVYFLL